MALVYRNGRPRLQRSVRRGDRVTTEYQASGEVALLISQMETLKRVQRDLGRIDFEAERERLEAAERVVVDYCDRVEDLVCAALIASGFHQHRRQWRKRRGRPQEI